MSISVFGIIYILITLALCFKRKWFTYWFVFSNSLYYTSVLTVGDFPVKPCYVSILVMFFVFVRSNILTRNSFRQKDISSLFLFLVWIYVSFFCSFFLKNIQVLPSDSSLSDYSNLQMLHATWGSVTQTIFPLYGIFSYFVIKAYIKTKQDIKDFTRGYVLSFIPLVITVIVLFIFRNVIHASSLTQLFFSFIYPTYSRNVEGNTYGSIGDIARTFTYIGEASYTAKYYLVMVSLFVSMLLYKKNTNFQKTYLLFIFLLLIAMITILGSTTAYVGVIMLGLIIAFLYFRYHHIIPAPVVRSNSNFMALTTIFGFLIIIPLVLIFYDKIMFFINYLLVNNVDKIAGDEGSGVIRLGTNLIGINVFLQSPLFGVGYGHNRTTSYFSFLLSNVGIVGFLLFNFFCWYLIVMSLKKLKRMPGDLKVHCMIYVTMFIITYIINCSFSGTVAIAFGWVWSNAAILGSLINWRGLEDVKDDDLEVDYKKRVSYKLSVSPGNKKWLKKI